MIFGIGLPRCAGQTLGDAIGIVTMKRIWHSIEGHRWDVLEPGDAGAVEVYAPYDWLERHWPGSLFIANYRAADTWVKSCQKVYEKSQEQRWNHPLWQFPPTSWLDYYNEYWERVKREFPQDRVFWWDIIEDPTWGNLCAFLGYDVPSSPFPNTDKHGRTDPVVDSEAGVWPSPW